MKENTKRRRGEKEWIGREDRNREGFIESGLKLRRETSRK
jgi:hypothetical protein